MAAVIECRHASATGEASALSPRILNPKPLIPEEMALQVRAEAKRQMSGKYSAKLATTQKRKTHAEANPLPVSELADVFKEGA